MVESLRERTVAEVGLRQPLRTPFERYPHGTDIGMALLAFTLNLSMWTARDDLDMSTFVGVGSWLVAFTASYSLLWRRSHATLVHGIVLAASVLMLVSPLADGIVALTFTLYSLGRYEADRRVSFAGMVAAFVFVAIDLKLVTEPDVGDTIAAGLAIGIWYVGRRMRFRGEYLRLLEERAQHLEREQHTEAERAVAAERTRIAREMHDVVAHQVSLMTVQAGAARTITESDPTAAGDAMAAVENAGRQALTEMRGLLGVLRPAEDTEALAPQPGLAELPALVQQVGEVGPNVTLEQSGELDSLPSRIQLSIYRIVQEALTNVIKHAGADVSVAVTITGADDAVDLRVTDNGRGTNGASDGGHGIIGMRERATLLGGTLDATASGGGFEVHAVLPRRSPKT
ncbi:MAG: sensor histidine kinase [Pseudomonadota bacterium]